MMPFLPLPRGRRRVLIGLGVALATVSAFGIYQAASGDAGSPPVNVTFVLGGGSKVKKAVGGTPQGTGLAIQGSFRGLAAATDGTVYLFTQEDQGMVMWKRETSGSTARIPLTGLDNRTAEQTAVASDGSIYLATGDSLWKIGPDGKTIKLVETKCDNPRPFVNASIDEFCTGQVTGVTITADGTVYFGDQTVLGQHASYVHKISGDMVELVAGRPPQDNESLLRTNPAVKNGIDPPAGTKAKDVLVPAIWDSGWLTSSPSGIYWRTGPGIVRINADDTLTPLVGARDPDSISELKGPFDSIGSALDAEIGRGSIGSSRGDLTTLPDRSEIYYTDAHETYSPPFSSEYRWAGEKTASQKDFIDNLLKGKVIYQVSGENIAPVMSGVQAIAASGDSLYIAAESESDNRATGVLQVELPEMS
ncbi:hypothetical protein [Streptomyces griseoflavus]|uniref:LigA protein n=1 Tax=Streptomyces griseoflavus Tu4000 TaxID=467200 RepID=D9XXS4_9ACTN|nr:hypothetical protein [Streptomyces griseoflavus]EFL39850.1 hypothetical protein SSRG_02654 [Streptomyces griseoflavus Tu4000]